MPVTGRRIWLFMRASLSDPQHGMPHAGRQGGATPRGFRFAFPRPVEEGRGRFARPDETHDTTEHPMDLHRSAAVGHAVVPRPCRSPDAEHRPAGGGGDGVRPDVLPEPDLHAEPGIVPEREVSDRAPGAAERERRVPGRHRAGAAAVPGCRIPDRADRQAAPVAGATAWWRSGRRTTGTTSSTGAITRIRTGRRGTTTTTGSRSAGSMRGRSTIRCARSGRGWRPRITRRPGRGSGRKRFMRRHEGRPWFLSINLFDPHPPFDPPASHLARFDRAEMPGPVFAPSDLDHQRGSSRWTSRRGWRSIRGGAIRIRRSTSRRGRGRRGRTTTRRPRPTTGSWSGPATMR